MVKLSILHRLTKYYRSRPVPTTTKIHGRRKETVQTVACTHINSRTCDDMNEDVGIRNRHMSLHSDIGSFDYEGDYERDVRHQDSSFSDENLYQRERARSCSSMSSITIPLEISCYSSCRPVLKPRGVSDGRLIKIVSKSNPHVLRAKTIYVPRYGHGYVLKIKKRFGRATKFIILFEKLGILTMALSRRPGQKGEFFFVRDSVIGN